MVVSKKCILTVFGGIVNREKNYFKNYKMDIAILKWIW